MFEPIQSNRFSPQRGLKVKQIGAGVSVVVGNPIPVKSDYFEVRKPSYRKVVSHKEGRIFIDIEPLKP